MNASRLFSRVRLVENSLVSVSSECLLSLFVSEIPLSPIISNMEHCYQPDSPFTESQTFSGFIFLNGFLSLLFHLFAVLATCGGLSWLPVSFLSICYALVYHSVLP